MVTLLGVVVLVLDVIAILNIIQSGMRIGKKILWTLLVLLLPVVGMLLYFAVGPE